MTSSSALTPSTRSPSSSTLVESLIMLQYHDDVFPNTPTSSLRRTPPPPAKPTPSNYVDKKLYHCGFKLWRLKGDLQAAVRCKMVEIL
uniref:Uncharacterized protein n=1 Tax=Oryza meridionalis TaxID=40149 RepID=A0A0E0D0H0_9ORYZ